MHFPSSYLISVFLVKISPWFYWNIFITQQNNPSAYKCLLHYIRIVPHFWKGIQVVVITWRWFSFLAAIAYFSVISRSSILIPFGSFLSKWCNSWASTSWTLVVANAKPGQTFLTEPNGSNWKWFPFKSMGEPSFILKITLGFLSSSDIVHSNNVAEVSLPPEKLFYFLWNS